MSWEQIKLGALEVELRTGFASGTHGGAGELVHLRPMNISPRGALTFAGSKYVASAAGDQRVSRGDVLFNNTNSPKWVGKTAWIDTDQPLAFSNHMTRLRAPAERMDARFLAMQLHHLQAIGFFEAICSNHVNQASVSRKQLLDVSVALPPLDEQRRTVAILEGHLSHLDAADRDLATAEHRVRAWQAAKCEAALRYGNPSVRRVGDLLREGMRNGRSDRATTGGEKGIRTLTLTAVTRNQFIDDFTKETVTTEPVAKGLWLESGDIFVQRANTPELVGTAARFDGPSDWAIFPDLLIRLRPDESQIDGRYLVAALRSERVHRGLRARAKGLAGSMPKIDQRAVAETVVPCPDLGQQRRAVAAIDEAAAVSRRLLVELKTQSSRSLALRRSLLSAAFSGRLTGADSRA